MKTVHSSEEFRTYILEELNFQLIKDNDYYRLYQNAQNELYHFYFRKNCYEFGIAEYTILHDFRVSFHNPTHLLRFGIVYEGTTKFRLNGQLVDSFSPSSFFVMEKNIKGQQVWKTGQHFHGTEITIYGDYFEQVVWELTGKPYDFSSILLNSTYHFLSLEMTKCIQQMQELALSGNLNPIYLDSKIRECIALIYDEYYNHSHDFYTAENHSVSVSVGSRSLTLNPTDITRIRQAHEILTKEYTNPPTIDALSQIVLLDSQKLKVGFHHLYHQTIGDFITTLKMVAAANLLCTTTLHIADIALKLGYSQTGNFIHMFRKYYGLTPLQYRKKSEP